MMQIKQSTASLALVFFMVDSTDHVTGKTGLTPTVTLSKNGGAFAAAAGSFTEIGNGFYKIAPNATDSNTVGVLALTATATGADRCAMAYEVVAFTASEIITAISTLNNLSAAQVRTELATELARIDASISTLTPTAPDNAGIAAIKAKTDNLPTDPADQSILLAAIPSIEAIIGAAGGLTSETVALLEAAEQILLAAPYVPDAAPALIIPAPAGDESLTVVYAHTENIANAKRAGIVLSFQLQGSPAKSERILEAAAVTATTDADGYAQITLQSGLPYRVTCRPLALNHVFTPTGETFDLLTLIP
jgi:hypothetical protein